MAETQTSFRPDQTPIVSNILANPPSNSILESVFGKYPKLKGLGFEIIDSRDKKSPHGGKLEFYHPRESRSPNPGKPTIELFEGVRGENLPVAVFGDMLHYLPEVMPEFSQKRQDFEKTITEDQRAVDRKAYERAVLEHGESRSFEDWFELNRLDAYIRGFLAPDKANEWKNVYTPEQTQILNEMKALVQ